MADEQEQVPILKALHNTQPYFVLALCVAVLFLQFQINALTERVIELQKSPSFDSPFCKVVDNSTNTAMIQVNNSKLPICG